MTYKWLIKLLSNIPGASTVTSLLYRRGINRNAFDILDLKFSSPIGIGSGIDPNGESLKLLSSTGVGFCTIGPVSPANVRTCISRLMSVRKKSKCLTAAAISSNSKSIDDEQIISDFLYTFSLAYDFADLFFLDFTAGNMDPVLVRSVISSVMEARATYEEYKPIIIDTGKDLDTDELESMLDFCRMNGADAIAVWGSRYVELASQKSEGRYPIAGHGNIHNAEDARRMLKNGASLVILRDEILRDGLGFPHKIISNLK